MNIDEWNTKFANAPASKPAPKPAVTPAPSKKAMSIDEWNAQNAGKEAPGDERLPAAPAAPMTPQSLGRRVFSREGFEDFVGGAADLADMGLVGVPGMVMASIGDILNRAQGLVDSRSRREVGQTSQELYEKMAPKVFRPLLTKAGILREDTAPTAVQQVETWFAEELNRSAESAEERSGGKILKEDYLSVANTLMAALGGRGAMIAGERLNAGIDARREAKKQADFTRAVEEKAFARATEPPAAPPSRPIRAATAAEEAARTRAETVAREQKRADVEAAFSESPGYADMLRAEAEGAAAMRERAQAEATARAAELGRLPGEGFPQRSRPPEATTVDEAPRQFAPNQFGDLQTVSPSALDSGLAKIARGRRFDLTAQELAAVNASKSAWRRPDLNPEQTARSITDFQRTRIAEAFDEMRNGPTAATRQSAARVLLKDDPELPKPPPSRPTDIALAAGLTAAAVGAALLGDEDDLAGAASLAGGAFLVGRMADASPSTPLGAFREAASVTFDTLEQLPGNKFSFGKPEIENLLKRQNVTDFERKVVGEALASVPGDRITAKDLYVGLEKASQPFQLRPVETQQLADYGLDSIGRKDRFSGAFDEVRDPADFDTAQARLGADGRTWEVFDANGDYITNFMRDRTLPDETSAIARARTENQRLIDAPASATTTIYQSPLAHKVGNHFDDRNYFAHTRSFVEGGVRHVVEVQSDLAQKAAAKMTPEQLAAAKAELANVEKRLVDIRTEKEAANVALSLAMRQAQQSGQDATGEIWSGANSRRNELVGQLEAERRNLQVRYGELGAKITTAETGAAIRKLPVAPMLKNWDRRLIREEIARALQPMPNPAWEEAQIVLERAKYHVARDADVNLLWPDRAADSKRMLELAQKKLDSTPKEIPSAPVIRFATADTVAKVEGWPEVPQPLDYNIQAPSILREYESELRKEAGTDAAELAKVPSRVETARRSMEIARKNGILFENPEHANIYARYADSYTKYLKSIGGKEVTDSTGNTWIEVPIGKGQTKLPAGGMRSQMGFADPKLLGAITLIGGGAALGAFLSSEENKGLGLALGAGGVAGVLLGLAKLREHPSSAISEMVRDVGQKAEYVLGNVSSQLRDLHQPTLRLLTRHEWGRLKGVQDAITQAAPLVKILSEVPQEARARLDATILNGKASEVGRELGKLGVPGAYKAWQDANAVLKQLGDELVKYGELRQLRPDYFPRLVVDYEGLMKYLGTEAKDALQKKIEEANLKSIEKTGTPIDAISISEIVNKYIESGLRSGGGGKPGFLKNRTIAQVTTDLVPFYAPASESLPIYIESAVARIERAKFFGKSAVRDPETRRINIEASVGNLLAEDLASGKLSREDAAAVRGLLASRFGAGEGNPSRVLAAARNAGYIALMGNSVSAIQNLADAGSIWAINGTLPTIKGLAATLTRRPQRITSADLGLARNMAEEFVHGTRKPFTVAGRRLSLAKMTDTVFKYSGFAVLDRGMKEVKANATIADYSAKAKTARGEAAIRQRYDDYFRTDMSQLLEDLRAGRKSPLVYELAFRELSDTQPTTRIEVPEAYLENPNLRPLYMLKSFSLKQINLLRDRGIKEIRRGNVGEGTKFLLRYALGLGVAGATIEQITSAILGRDSELELSDVPENALKAFGWSQFVTDKFREGKEGEALAGMIAPPIGVFAEFFATEPQRDEEGRPIPETSQWRGARYIPWVGRIYYEREMGGAARYNAREEERRRREEEGQ